MQRRGALAWERGPGFLALSLGLQPQDLTAPLSKTIWKWTVDLTRTRQASVGIFSR